MSSKKQRVADAIRDTLAEMLAREVKDPRVTAAGVVSITHVEMNVDHSVATISVSVLDEAKAERALAGLRGAAGFLRGPLARRLRLARPPELRFVRDTGIAFGIELAKIVREDEEKARAAGREAGEAPAPPDDAPAPPDDAPAPPDEDDDDDEASDE